MGDDHWEHGAERSTLWTEAFHVPVGEPARLGERSTLDPRADAIGKAAGRRILADTIACLSALQEVLYAERRWSVLLILQAMDAGGKDGTIKHVLSGVNPQGLSVVSFKPPGPEELAHDFLWRVHRAVPARGMIGVFNRSHYEEAVIARVHPDLLEAQRLPEAVTRGPAFWDDRLTDMAAFETYLARQGTRIVKVFLHLGQDEQKARLRARLDDPDKLWKFDPADLSERQRWSDYRAAYEAAITATSTAEAPWFVVPADQKWFARMVVADLLVAALASLGSRMPEPSPEVLRQLDAARQALD